MQTPSTRRVFLDFVRPSDFPLVYELFVDPDTGPLFRFGGRIPPPEYVQEHLTDGILVQWMVAGIQDRKRRGIVSIGSPDFVNGYAYVSALATPESRNTGLVLEGVGLALDYCFGTWPFRKIYAEVSELSLPRFHRVVGRFCVEEGRLRQHHYQRGKFRDVMTLAFYRDHWPAIRSLLTRLGADPLAYGAHHTMTANLDVREMGHDEHAAHSRPGITPHGRVRGGGHDGPDVDAARDQSTVPRPLPDFRHADGTG